MKETLVRDFCVEPGAINVDCGHYIINDRRLPIRVRVYELTEDIKDEVAILREVNTDLRARLRDIQCDACGETEMEVCEMCGVYQGEVE